MWERAPSDVLWFLRKWLFITKEIITTSGLKPFIRHLKAHKFVQHWCFFFESKLSQICYFGNILWQDTPSENNGLWQIPMSSVFKDIIFVGNILLEAKKKLFTWCIWSCLNFLILVLAIKVNNGECIRIWNAIFLTCTSTNLWSHVSNIPFCP